jgi:hypothetical protein
MERRLPDRQAIFQVYAVIAILFAGWTITAFLWKLSAWLLLLNMGELVTVFSYAMAANFVESLIVLLCILAAAALLPVQFLRDDFVVRGTILSLGMVGALIAFVGGHMRFGLDSGLLLLIAPLSVLFLMGLLLIQSSQPGVVRSAVLWLADRLTVFLLILLPLFALASAYVIVRNLV